MSTLPEETLILLAAVIGAFAFEFYYTLKILDLLEEALKK